MKEYQHIANCSPGDLNAWASGLIQNWRLNNLNSEGWMLEKMVQIEGTGHYIAVFSRDKIEKLDKQKI